jgi:hypothetical protein
VTHSNQELEAVFQRGLEAGRKEDAYRFLFKGLPAFAPWTQRVEFEAKPTLIESLVTFERCLLEQLRRIQRERWVERRGHADLQHDLEEVEELAGRAPEELSDIAWPYRWKLRLSKPWLKAAAEVRREFAEHLERSGQMAEIQRLIEAELSTMQRAVDAELDTGRGHACTVQAMRAAPVRPVGVREYPVIDAFLDQDSRRELIGGPGPRDAGGQDYGWYWRLENPLRRWETTRWRLSWLCVGTAGEAPTYEIYAVEIGETEGLSRGRVWLMGVVLDGRRIADILSDLEQHAQGERNSLVVVASRINQVIKAIHASEDSDF